jgi:hypothetical protein
MWSQNSPASIKEFPEFVTINRMYRDRDFKLVTLNMDGSGEKEKVMLFLRQEQASNSNFITNPIKNAGWYNSVNPGWKGDLPYTLLIEPNGKIVYAKEGSIDAAELKRTIVNNHLIGRYP